MIGLSWLFWGSVLAAVFWAYQAVDLAVWLHRPAPRVVQRVPLENAPQPDTHRRPTTTEPKDGRA